MNKHYETLGLKPSASQEEIKNAYYKLSKKFHPDNNDGDEYFSEMFKNYKEAYEVLSNESQKADDVREYHNNDSANTAEKAKDSVPQILSFESDKYAFEEGESIRLSWKTTNVDEVIIKPFGTVNNSGTKVFKLKNFDKETLSITLQAKNNLNDETVTKTIKLKNNIIEFDFSTIPENGIAKPMETIEEKVELPEPVKKVHVSSFAPSIAETTLETKESFFSSNGRLRRSSYFWRSIILGILSYLMYLGIMNSYNDNSIIILGLGLIVVMYFGWIQTVKRLHDLNQSGWLSLLQLIPIVNLAYGFYIIFYEGTNGPNQYGADPKNF